MVLGLELLKHHTPPSGVRTQTGGVKTANCRGAQLYNLGGNLLADLALNATDTSTSSESTRLEGELESDLKRWYAQSYGVTCQQQPCLLITPLIREA